MCNGFKYSNRPFVPAGALLLNNYSQIFMDIEYFYINLTRIYNV